MRTVVSGLLGIVVALAGFSAPVFARNAPSHIVIVIEENHGADQIVGNPNMPYLNKTLIAGGLLLTNSHGVEHPSQPNYLDLFSGGNQGVTNDGPVPGSNMDPSKQTALTSGNIAAAMIHRGYSFRAYSQSLPSLGSLAYFSDGKHEYKAVPKSNPGAFIYARKHNPWTDWQVLWGYARPGNTSNTLPGGINQPLSDFPSNFNKLPTLAFVIPNQCNDMHGGVSGSTTTENCPYPSSSGDAHDVQLARNADGFLRKRLGAYAAWAKTHNSLLIVTWDENESSSGSNRITTVFYGAGIKPGSRSNQRVNHFNVLATIGTYYGLDLSQLGHAATAAPIAAALSAR
ncbi:MAG: alkaline phosphatase family protein [Acidihalobacter sp.]